MTDEVPGPVPDEQRGHVAPAALVDGTAFPATPAGAGEVEPGEAARTFGPLTYVGLVVGGLFIGVLGDGFAVAGPGEQDAMLAGWGAALTPLARDRCLVTRITWQEWAHPIGVGTHREFLTGLTARPTPTGRWPTWSIKRLCTTRTACAAPASPG